MLVEKLKQIFVVGVLGLFLAGCSSTPTEEGSDVTTSQQTSQTGTGSADAAAVESAAVAEANKAADMLAALAGKRVHFDFDRSEVKADFYEVIKMHADYLAINTNAKVTVEGHCDERGSREYNLALGERRANAVKNALIAQGVQANRINVNSFGEDRPLVNASNNEAWAQNRRAEFVY